MEAEQGDGARHPTTTTRGTRSPTLDTRPELVEEMPRRGIPDASTEEILKFRDYWVLSPASRGKTQLACHLA